MCVEIMVRIPSCMADCNHPYSNCMVSDYYCPLGSSMLFVNLLTRLPSYKDTVRCKWIVLSAALASEDVLEALFQAAVGHRYHS